MENELLGNLYLSLKDLFGVGDDGVDVSTGEMLLRLLVIYPLGIVMMRIGDKRFLGDLSAFDLVVGIILGSILSRAITGNAPLVPCIVVAFGMVLIHRAIARVAFHSDRVGRWVKGQARLLVEDGAYRWEEMRRGSITETDLEAALRRKARIRRVEDVEVAYLERTGDFSVIPKSRRDA